MEFMTLNNGITMPLLGFGTFLLSGDTCVNAVASAITKGYRMIDTAEAYENEKEVGLGIQKSGIDRKEPLIGKPETPELVEFSLTW